MAVSLVGIAVPVVAAAQAPVRTPLLGFLYAGSPESGGRVEAFKEGLHELGYVVGRNIIIEYRFAEDRLERLPDLAAELVRLNPDVIVSAPTPANLAVRQATATIPIVMALSADPVGLGLVASLGRPGGNVTGLTGFADELPAKLIELAGEVVPHANRIAVLLNVDNPLHVPQWQNAQTAGAATVAKLVPVEVSSALQLADAFAAIARQRVDVLVVTPDTVFLTRRKQIAELAAAARLPAIYGIRDHAEDGGLISYGVNSREGFRRAAFYVDKILKGAKPADLPVERPTRFEMVINLKTAKALGIEIPASILARADEVIE
jgi:putative ABC transport system substrate-binding protein